MNCIAMRVAIVSAIMNGFAGLRTSVPVYNILDFLGSHAQHMRGEIDLTTSFHVSVAKRRP